MCGDSIPSIAGAAPQYSMVCGLCRRAKPPFAVARAFGSYEGNLRELIHLLKYERVHPAAALLGAAIAPVLRGLTQQVGPDPLLIPVPLYNAKFRQRGFNQSEMIAREALKSAPTLRPTLSTRVLARVRDTQSQIGLTRHQRRENLRGAFVVRDPGKISGRPILLLDDVLTTGTTASECARVLLRAGAKRVAVATVARTMKEAARLSLGQVSGFEAPRAFVAASRG